MIGRLPMRLYFLDQTSLDRLDGDPDAFGAAVGGPDADSLKVGAKLALRDAGHVRADAAALLRLTLAIDDRALNGTATGDCTDSGHDDFDLVKGSGVKARSRAKQGEFWFSAARGELGTSVRDASGARAGAARVCAG
jgi:hypothetical protein